MSGCSCSRLGGSDAQVHIGCLEMRVRFSGRGVVFEHSLQRVEGVIHTRTNALARGDGE